MILFDGKSHRLTVFLFSPSCLHFQCQFDKTKNKASHECENQMQEVFRTLRKKWGNHPMFSGYSADPKLIKATKQKNPFAVDFHPGSSVVHPAHPVASFYELAMLQPPIQGDGNHNKQETTERIIEANEKATAKKNKAQDTNDERNSSSTVKDAAATKKRTSDSISTANAKKQRAIDIEAEQSRSDAKGANTLEKKDSDKSHMEAEDNQKAPESASGDRNAIHVDSEEENDDDADAAVHDREDRSNGDNESNSDNHMDEN